MAHRPHSSTNVAKIGSNTTLSLTSTSGSAINVSTITNRNKQQSICSWRDIFALHRDVLPFAGERTDEVATNLSTSYNIHIQQLDGLQLKGEELKVEYEVRLHLYDVTYKVFFGKSWIGPRRMIKKDTSQGSRLHYNVPIYFHTSLADPNIILVIEIVQVSVSKNGHVQLLSNGWGILRLFQQGDYTDTSQSTPSVIRRQELFHGSPRALFFLGDDISDNKDLTAISDCQVSYTIRTHRYMDKILHLVPENVLLSGSDRIPGIALVDPKEGGDSLRRPKPLQKVVAVLDKISVLVYPTVDSFEEELCKQLCMDRLAVEHVQQDKSNVVVSERRLRIGVHNGWGYVGKPQVFLLDTPPAAEKGNNASMKRTKGRQKDSRQNLGSALLVPNKAILSSLAKSPHVSIVFLLEYIITVPASTQDRKLAASMNRAQTQKVALCWASWTPSFKQNTCEVSIQMQGGPVPNPDNTMIFKNYSVDSSNKEISTLSSGKINFVFKIKKEEDSRPASPQSPEPTQSQRQVSVLDAPADQKSSYSSVASLPSPTTMTEQASSPADAQNGRPPLSPIIPTRLPVTSPMVPVTSHPIRPTITHQVMANTGQPLSAIQGPIQQQYQLLAQASPHVPNSMDIKHLEVETTQGAAMDLEELPFTPVHAPIMPRGSYSTRGHGLSRASFAHLYQAGFEDIKDRHGEIAEVIDPTDHINLNPDKENNDPLQCNEIVLQFLALSRVLQFQESTPPSLPRTVFFTFQFYRYPAITTERLILGNVEGKLTSDSKSLPCVLRKMKNDDAMIEEVPGWMIRYNVDPSFLKPGEGRLFGKYLYQQTLHIDVWDGDTLLLLGSCAVELKHLLRCGRESVQVTHELDVITTDYNDETNTLSGDMTRSGSVHPIGVTAILKGRLHLRLANIGHPLDSHISKMEALSYGDSKVVVKEDGSGAFLGGSVNLCSRQSGLGLVNLKQKRSYVASHMAETDRDLASALFSKRTAQGDMLQTSKREGDAKKQRKLARMQALRQAQADNANISGLSQTVQLKKEENVQRTRDLKTIELYRDRSKKEGILSMLQSAITTEHIIHPSFGHAEFFEYVLRNPYNVQHTVTVQWEDPELSIITNPREWRHFKQLFETYTAVEENMFIQSNQRNDNGSGLQLFLRPKETVNVPFKYQSFKAKHSVQPQGPPSITKPHFKIQLPQDEKEEDLALSSKNLKVYFQTKDNKCIAILNLNVEPQPPIIDQTFRFNHPEQSFLKKSIRLPPFHSFAGFKPGGGGIDQLFVKCSDENAICDTKKVPSGDPQDVFIKVACGLSPSIKMLFILIYSSPFMSRPLQTWQLYIHALQRIDVSCVEGQTSRQALLLKGTHSSRLVQCFSSHPNEMQMLPSEPFMLLANSVHEVHVGVRPLFAGKKFMYINVVDKEYHQLIRSWLVCVQCRRPVISKAFELQLPVGGGKGSNKRITYTNPYANSKLFNIRCNRDDLLQFKETTIEVGGGETCGLGLRFTPCQHAGIAEILIFINDQHDNNEETFLIRSIYS